MKLDLTLHEYIGSRYWKAHGRHNAARPQPQAAEALQTDD